MANKNETELQRLARKRDEAAEAATNAQTEYRNYVNAGYKPDANVEAKRQAYETYNNQLANYTPYANPNATAMQSALDAIVNRGAFKFQTDGDALYERYKNNYQAAGKKAMQDTMGAAAMLTRGYGNSYAATAGAQAYNDYLSKMDDVIPSLYQLALDKYNAEGNELAQRYNLLAADDDRGYSRWSNDRAIIADLADRAGSDYNSERSFDYGRWSDRGSGLNALYDMAQDAYSNAAAAENTQYGREWDEDERAYQRNQDAISNALAYAKAAGGGGGSAGGGTTAYTYASYDKLPDFYKEQINDYAAKGNYDAVDDVLMELYNAGLFPYEEANAISNMIRSGKDNKVLSVMVGNRPVSGTEEELKRIFGR